MSKRSSTTFRPLVVVVTVALLSYLAVTGAAVWAYDVQVSRAMAGASAQMGRVGRGNASVIEYWFGEREADISVLASTSRVRTEFESYLAGDQAAGDWLKLRLEAERTAHGCVNITLFDTSGKIRLILGQEFPGHIHDITAHAVQAAKMTTGVISSGHPASDGSYHVMWLAPLRVNEGPGPQRTTGVVMYEADLKTYLQQVIASVDNPWPTTVALRVSDDPDAYVASTSTGFNFGLLGGREYPGGGVVASAQPLGTTAMSVVAFVTREAVIDSLAWERSTIVAVDALALLSCAGFVLAFARSDRDRRKELVAKERLEEAMETQDRFLANMSHDLRTPLNSIIGFSSVLKNGMAGPLTDEQLLQIGMIEASGKHLLALVTDVLDLSKMNAGMEDVDPETFRVRELVDSVTGILAPQVAEKGLTWHTAVPASLEIVTDRALAERVVLNLAGNAVKFTVNGGVDITVTRRGDQIAIAVHDTGPGIEDGSREDIMREFKQAFGTSAVKPEGAGLGLAISERIAALLGGSIEIESAPGEGATFTFVLPADGALL
ncbi:MAG: HAMP domain-containing histidine kinase [Actinomycetia bacterium]|nr:HAMP domain-containing histidine kinase [Actinomycetes bacterium]